MNNLSTTSKERADYEWAVELNRYNLSIIGLWPENTHHEGIFLKKLRVPMILMAITIVCTIPCFCRLFMKCNDLIAYMDSLGYCIPFLITQLKYIVIYKKRNVLLPVLNMIADDWAKSKTDVEKIVMIRRARVGRAFNTFGYVLVILLFSFAAILPRFGIQLRYMPNETDAFPLPTYYVYDVSQSPYYEIIFIVQIIVLIPTISCYLGIDNFFGILILHICGQLENLRARLANVKKSENFDRVLATTVMDHTRLIRAVNAIENTFTLLLLALLLYFGMFACIYGLILVTMSSKKDQFSPVRMFFLLCSLTNTFVQTSLYCVAGQILVTESEGVYDAVYECEWLNLKSKEAKSLILIMVRAKKPLCVSAGKLFPMTMLTFCSILKVSLSYTSFLLTKVQ